MAHHQPIDMSRIALKCGRRAEQHVGAIDIDIPIVEIEECRRAAKGDRPVEIDTRGRRFDNDILGRRSRIRSGDCGLPIRPFALSVACDRSNSKIITVCASSTCCCQKRGISKRKRKNPPHHPKSTKKKERQEKRKTYVSLGTAQCVSHRFARTLVGEKCSGGFVSLPLMRYSASYVYAPNTKER